MIKGLILPIELSERLGTDPLVVLDCSVDAQQSPNGDINYLNGRPLFEASHIPGARHADLVSGLSSSGDDMLFGSSFARGLSRTHDAPWRVR